MEERLSAAETQLQQRLSAVEARLDQRLSAVEARLQQRLSGLQRLSALEKRLEDLEWQRNADKVERSRYMKPGATET